MISSILSSLHQDQRRSLHNHNIDIEKKACVLGFDKNIVDLVDGSAVDESVEAR